MMTLVVVWFLVRGPHEPAVGGVGSGCKGLANSLLLEIGGA